MLNPSLAVQLSADTASPQKQITTKELTSGVSVIVTAASSLGGGTLTLLTRPAGSEVDPEPIGVLTPGLQDYWRVGGNMDVLLSLTGSSNPDVTVFISESRRS